MANERILLEHIKVKRMVAVPISSVSTAMAHIMVTNVTGGILGTNSVNLAVSASDSGNLFRLSGDQYMYNLNTGQLTAGTWQIKVVLDDGNSYSALISLR